MFLTLQKLWKDWLEDDFRFSRGQSTTRHFQLTSNFSFFTILWKYQSTSEVYTALDNDYSGKLHNKMLKYWSSMLRNCWTSKLNHSAQTIFSRFTFSTVGLSLVCVWTTMHEYINPSPQSKECKWNIGFWKSAAVYPSELRKIEQRLCLKSSFSENRRWT